MRLFLAIVVLGISAGFAQAQRMRPSNDPDKHEEQDPFMSTPLADMKVRAALRRSDKDHQENLDRASEVARLSSELRTSFLRGNSLTEEDRKKVERIEKLTKRIRGAAGGSDGEFSQIIPMNLGDAINQIATTADELNKRVIATPKLVVSANLIEQTNQLLDLVRFVRGSDR
jgi:hypothetical protein